MSKPPAQSISVSSWEDTTLGDIFELVGGGTPDKKEPNYWNGDIPWASVKDLKGTYLSATQDSITDKGFRNSATSIADAGDVILATRIAPGSSIIATRRVAINQDLKIARSHGKALPKFSHYLFRSLSEEFVRRSSGTTVLGIRIKEAGAIPIHLPPLHEQHRIVEKIEALFSELDNGAETLQTAREQLNVYRQAVLKHAFEGRLTEKWRRSHFHASVNINTLIEDIEQERRENYEQELIEWNRQNTVGSRSAKPQKPFWHDVQDAPSLRIPYEWRSISMGDLCDAPRYGTSKKCTYDAAQGSVGVLRIPNLVSGVVDDSDLKYTRLDDKEHNALKLQENDLLIIRSNGSLSIVGTSARVHQADTRHIYAGYLIRIRLDTRSFDSGFLKYFLDSPAGRRQIESFAKSTSGVNNISAKELQAVQVPFCAPEEQDQIVQEIESRLSVIDDLEKTIDENLQKSEALRQSILKKAFAGELVPAEEVFGVDVLLHAYLILVGLYLHTHHQRAAHSFHRTKAEKMVHLAEYELDLKLRRNPSRAPRGPYDPEHLAAAEQCAQQMGWLKIEPNTSDKNWVDYLKGPSFNQGLDAARETLGDQFEAVAALFSTLEPLNYAAAEITATVYAAWNNFLLAGEKNPSDARIVRLAREDWHSEKQRYTPDQFQAQIDWIREQNLAPTGNGKIVRHRPVHPGQVELPLDTATD